MIKVNYQEWLKNVRNPEWTGWADVKFIESTVGASRTCNNWVQHSICFLNNYLLEKTVKEFLCLDYYGDDHEEWRAGKGLPFPDFIDHKTGDTYELKQMLSFRSLETIPERDWHNCDYKLVYTRCDGKLWKLDNEDNVTEIAYFRPLRIHFKELAIYEKEILSKERALRQ